MNSSAMMRLKLPFSCSLIISVISLNGDNLIIEKKTVPDQLIENQNKPLQQQIVEPINDFVATAYCLRGATAAGTEACEGVIAADPRVLPLGTIVHIRSGKYTGKYTVLDTGLLIKGRKIDIYVSDCSEAVRFGRRPVKLRVLKRPLRRRSRSRLAGRTKRPALQSIAPDSLKASMMGA